MHKRFALLVLLLVPMHLAADTNWESRGGKYRVSYQSELDPLVINRIHAWTLTISDDAGTPVEGAVITVDGGMPAHDHGLPTQPRVTEDLGDGYYRLDGVRFHMSGYWEMVVTIRSDDSEDTVVIPLTL